MEPLKDFLNQSNSQVSFDAGLRGFMLKVYNYMALALGLSGAVAYLTSTSDSLMTAIYTNQALMWLVMLAPLGFVLFLSFRINKMSLQAAQTTFWAYSAIMGLSLSFIFLVYTQASIVETFFVTAATFGGMSLYGYTTKRDLTGMGHFLIMGLFGIIIASIVNIFVGSGTMNLVISILGILIFVGLTAYDTQKLKHIYYAVSGNAEASGKASIMGALNLYLDFINLFLYLLRFMGNRK